jgi:hypothetical protein
VNHSLVMGELDRLTDRLKAVEPLGERPAREIGGLQGGPVDERHRERELILRDREHPHKRGGAFALLKQPHRPNPAPEAPRRHMSL